MNVRSPLPGLNGDVLDSLVREATSAFVTIRPKLDQEDKDKNIYVRLFQISRDGGYKGLIEHAKFAVFEGVRLDYVQIRCAETYSYEKAIRLAKFYKRDQRIRSSFETDYDRTQEQYGGAFLTECHVPQLSPNPVMLLPSISGIGEKEDEAIGLRIMQRMPWRADSRYIGDVRRISKNALAEWLLAQ